MKSVQRVVSDGTLQIVDLSIAYFDRSEINVYVNAAPYTDWHWASDVEDRIIFNSPIPAGVEVLIKRTTDLSKLRHYFSKGSAFTAEALDEDLQQVLHIAQEATEASLAGDFYTDINMHGHRVKNIGQAVDDSDALTLRQYKQDAQGAFVARNQAEQFKNEAASYAGSAQTSATNAAASASAAAQSAQDSLAAADSAQTYATSAAASASAAAQSATNAATSATAAAASFDAFDDRYLGAKASDPTTDNDGNALQVGALYWNTSANEMRVWNGSSWRVAVGSLVGNADTATRLQTARMINGTSFDGSADITTAKWGAARTITIGNTGKSVDGSSDVSWSLDEIGAAAASTTVNLTGNQTITGIKTFTVSPVVPEPTEDNHAATAAYVNRRVVGAQGTSANIIGLVQTDTGGAGMRYLRIDKDYAPVVVSALYFYAHPTYAGIIQQIIDGQVMVRIPKFWFKAGIVPSGTYAGKAYWMISDQPVSGFSLHPAFIGAGGVELAQIWVGKYQASASGGKLQSVPGVLPRVSMDFPTARAEAYARNTGGVTGFRLLSYYDLAAIQMLATIEMGGLDMQSLIGQGRVSASSAANVDAADVAQATWRGIVGLWGNVWQMVDGIKRRDGTWWRWQYNVPGNTTTSDYSTGYVNTSRSALTTEGYPVTFDTTLLSSGIIIPAAVDSTQSNGSTGDYFYSTTSTDDRIAYHGSTWSGGAHAGLFYLAVYAAPSLAYDYIGARLAKV